MNIIAGQLICSNENIALVVSRFNELITQNLLKGALDALHRFGFNESQLTVVWVPGAFEIPLVTKQLAHSGNYSAVICLGAVIRGSTAHFDYVAGPVASSIAQISLEANIPVVFGVLTTDTIEQALERAGSKMGNKGYEAAITAVEMMSVLNQLKLKSHDSCTDFSSYKTSLVSDFQKI